PVREGAGCHAFAAHVAVMRLTRSEEHTSELQSLTNLVCRLLLEKKKNKQVAILIVIGFIGHASPHHKDTHATVRPIPRHRENERSGTPHTEARELTLHLLDQQPN